MEAWISGTLMVGRPPPWPPVAVKPPTCEKVPLAVALPLTVPEVPVLYRLPLACTEPEVPVTVMVPFISKSPLTRMAGFANDGTLVVEVPVVSTLSIMRAIRTTVPFGP